MKNTALNLVQMISNFVNDSDYYMDDLFRLVGIISPRVAFKCIIVTYS